MSFLKRKSVLAVIITAALIIGIVIALSVWISAADSVTYVKTQTGYISPSGVAINQSVAYVSDATSNKVYSVNISNNTVSDAKYSASQAVNNVYVKGHYVYALEGGLAGNVVRLNAADLTVDKTIETGHTPTDMIIHNGKIFVSCRYSSSVYVYNEADMAFIKEIAVSREPMAMTLAGNDIYVACHLNSSVAYGDGNDTSVVSAKVTVINTENDGTTDIQLPNGCGGVKGICTSEDGQYVYVSNIIARYTYPTSQLDRGWINTNGITILKTSDKSVLTSVLLDNVEEGASNPWDLVCSGKTLIVTISGTDEIMVIDTEKMFSNIQNVASTGAKTVERIPDYLPFMDNCKTRIKVENSKGLRNVALANGKVYICGYFTADISVYDVNTKAMSDTKIILGTQPDAKNDPIRLGEIIWNDANLCYQKWESCASCHPDARVDALNWDNLNDGLGNPKNVRSMVYSHRTPPVMSTGIRASAEIAVQAGMKYIQFNTMSQESFEAIDEYLKSLSPIDSPYLNRDGTLTADAQAGKLLFEGKAGCIACHYGPLYTDLDIHTSSSDIKNSWDTRDFVTPTLAETWNTGPWFAFGQYGTLRDAVAVSVKSDANLSDKEIDQLTAYVGSLGTQGEYFGVEQVRIRENEGDPLLYNGIRPGMTIYEMSVRKQLKTDSKAKVTITLYNKGGSEIASSSVNLDKEDMSVGEYAKFSLNINISEDIEVGAYYTVAITDMNSGTKLATDFTVYYRE